MKGEKRALSPSMALESTRKKPGQEKLECSVPDPAEGKEYELVTINERGAPSDTNDATHLLGPNTEVKLSLSKRLEQLPQQWIGHVKLKRFLEIKT